MVLLVGLLAQGAIADELKIDKTLAGVAGGDAKAITIGFNGPDGDTTFNGQVGAVFLHKTALSEVERKELEVFIAKGLSSAPSQKQVPENQ